MVTYAERETPDETKLEDALSIVADNTGELYPWDLVEEHGVEHGVLKHLVLQGELRIMSDGKLRPSIEHT